MTDSVRPDEPPEPALSAVTDLIPDDTDPRIGALYRLIAVDCTVPGCDRRCEVLAGRGRKHVRNLLISHLTRGHGWQPDAAEALALRLVPRLDATGNVVTDE